MQSLLGYDIACEDSVEEGVPRSVKCSQWHHSLLPWKYFSKEFQLLGTQIPHIFLPELNLGMGSVLCVVIVKKHIPDFYPLETKSTPILKPN